MQMSNNDPIKITAILEEMKNTDPKVKSDAIKNLNVVALAIGKDRSRNELLPYITGKNRV
jgi:hypothetical protein